MYCIGLKANWIHQRRESMNLKSGFKKIHKWKQSKHKKKKKRKGEWG